MDLPERGFGTPPVTGTGITIILTPGRITHVWWMLWQIVWARQTVLPEVVRDEPA